MNCDSCGEYFPLSEIGEETGWCLSCLEDDYLDVLQQLLDKA